MKLPKKLQNKLDVRQKNDALRVLKTTTNLIDFSSNDYLGFAKSESLFSATHQYLTSQNIQKNGATGSRLLSGNHALYSIVENQLSNFHQSETATIFNSGYDANIGFFSAIPQRDDIILFDELCHASIRDGIQLSNAKSYKFKHNNSANLAQLITKKRNENTVIYVVTEAVFSMDGDSPDLIAISKICQKNNAFLIVDEAHSVGVFGENGVGLVQELQLQNEVFARIITFGKALGCHGAAVLGSAALQQYIINFSRSFIYTTGLSPHGVATVKSVYDMLSKNQQPKNIQKLTENIQFFKQEVKRQNLYFIGSDSAIQSCIIPKNENVKKAEIYLQKKGFDVKAILSPTVQKEKERLRFCLHSYNSFQEIEEALNLLRNFVLQNEI